MKGQLSYEYYLSIFIFVIFIIYIILQVVYTLPNYELKIKEQQLKSEAYQLSEMLVNDPGEPINWNITHVKRVGLSDETKNKTNLLSIQKIRNLSLYCSSNYQDLCDKLGIIDYQFALNITDVKTNSLLVNCHPPQIISRRQKERITRIAAINSTDYVEIILEVW